MKISVLLPYKENFSEKYAGAVSLFVKDTIKNSKYFKSTYVFGNTSFKKPFLRNYINIAKGKFVGYLLAAMSQQVKTIKKRV